MSEMLEKTNYHTYFLTKGYGYTNALSWLQIFGKYIMLEYGGTVVEVRTPSGNLFYIKYITLTYFFQFYPDKTWKKTGDNSHE